MAEEPDRIRDDIEVTRAELARNVDRLADKTSPTRVAQRRWDATKAKVRNVSDRVMGSARDSGGTMRDRTGSAVDTVRGRAGDVADEVQHQAGQVADQVRTAPAAVRSQTQGNPLAAGLIAFGAGLLVGSLLPATEVEKRAAREVRDRADDLVEPIRQPLVESAQQVRDDLRDDAREAVASVRDTARDAAQTTAATAKDSAKGAAAEARESARSPMTT